VKIEEQILVAGIIGCVRAAEQCAGKLADRRPSALLENVRDSLRMSKSLAAALPMAHVIDRCPEPSVERLEFHVLSCWGG
jgi:hypothetical protein